ncbi:DUF2515 family protein [Cytobacillus gottheilii]|uniref:DUF2515 family protein n=1 Tax=Cytobacillus gottheilii TaxID=859144 RepID=UPI001118BBA2|nr:DUF2515 family protein [Cytobacillus gottheilii]
MLINGNSALDLTDHEIIRIIKNQTDRWNLDNISRTNAYLNYYLQHQDMQWAFLASMVSRNAGWNMCDLEGDLFTDLLSATFRVRLFLTYERANWLIFQDAYPQLLLYHYSTKIGKPLFHLLRNFHVSSFMEEEWMLYWHHSNKLRLMTSLIINEQNVIQRPVIEYGVYREKVFDSILFSLQDWFHFSVVLFPTIRGELYGASVHGFKAPSNRIELGKNLASILFSPEQYDNFLDFALRTEHTGSRYDYERYIPYMSNRKTPMLRLTFPFVEHHRHQYEDWRKTTVVKAKWGREIVKGASSKSLTEWYFSKQNQLEFAHACKKIMFPFLSRQRKR